MSKKFLIFLIGIVFCFACHPKPPGRRMGRRFIREANCKISLKKSTIQSVKKMGKTIPGVFGIAALHLQSNESFEINAAQRFPMTSSYKVAIAAYCLYLIEKGVISKNMTQKITKHTMRRYCFVRPGQCVAIKKMIQLMIEKSDNATSDIILKIVGGGKAVTSWLRKHGIAEMNVDRSTLKMCADYSGICSLGNQYSCTVQRYNHLFKKTGKKQSQYAARKFFTDKRDSTTPRAMVDLLVRLYKRKLLSKQATNFLLQCMKNCAGRSLRITRFLPKKTWVCSKGGTMDGIICDVGIVRLPQRKGHLALAIYTNNSVGHKRKREKILARISRKIFDYFVAKM